MKQKTIYLALALPGSGKTHKFLQTATTLINTGKKILYALPTTTLADEIMERLPSDINATRIDSSTRVKANVVRMLNDALMPSSGETFIICQHATLDKCSMEHLKDWILVVDETPTVLSLKHHTFKIDQFRNIKYIESVNGQVRIKSGMQQLVLAETQSYKSSKSNTSIKTASILSDDVHDIYDALINGYSVFVDERAEEDKSNQHEKHRTIRIIHERDFFPRFATAQETHILTATINDSLFDYYRMLNGHIYGVSKFTPLHRTVFPPIKIYPMLLPGVSFSKTIAYSESESQPNTKNLSVMVNRIKNHIRDEKCLLFTHKWGLTSYGHNIIACKHDSRGIDTLKYCNNAFVAIHGNPTPPERRSLEFLAKSHGTPLSKMLKAWEVTHKLEVMFQNAFRTSLRRMYQDDGALNNYPTGEVSLFVPDDGAVDFLKYHLHEAVVDGSLAASYRETKPKGRTAHPNREKMIRMIKEGYSNSQIATETEMSRTIICKERLTLGIPSKVKKKLNV